MDDADTSAGLAALEDRFHQGRLCLGTDIAEAAVAAAAAATEAAVGGNGMLGCGAWRPPPEVRLIVDPTLSVLARKLRMVGVDCTVAGEVLRARQPPPSPSPSAQLPPQPLPRPHEPSDEAGGDEAASGRGRRTLAGLNRVTIDGSAVDAHRRLAALEGRLLITAARRSKHPAPGATYRLLATDDATAQLAEVLTLLHLQEAVRHKNASRCGICNGDEWQTVPPSEVVGTSQVPGAVLRRQRVFYRCGLCAQIFWPNKAQPKSGKHEAPRGEEGSGGEAGSGTAATAEWRPTSQLVMALGANSQRGQMLREARGLHAALRTKLETPCVRNVQEAEYYY